MIQTDQIFKDIKTRYKLNNKQLGEALGVSDSMISRYVNNKALPSLDLLSAAIEKYPVSIDTHITGNTNQAETNTGIQSTYAGSVTQNTDAGLVQQLKIYENYIKSLEAQLEACKKNAKNKQNG